ncbi:alpha/beta hydrolase family protein [Liquorilactobacillus sicerae]|uniref:alpha/beta hydrolase family protein n=1 Tax=Liquorilactobacillus sicerae TaxID=1416943 RepID=UPI00247FFF72|nr:alpha/beta fold hydrolase [Liquorilactobacillus sicerae]
MKIAFKRDGLTLRGDLVIPSNTLKLVILLHGFTSDMGYTADSLIYQLAKHFNQAGLATLRFDFNGHGKSDGDFENMTVLNELADAKAALDYARAIPQIKKIMLLGHSQGGVIASMLAGYYPDLIQRLALLAPAASLKTDAQRGVLQGATYNPKHIPDLLTTIKQKQVGGFYLRIAQSLPIFEVSQIFQKPVCLIHGTNDQIVSPVVAKSYDKIYQNSTLNLLSGADHGLTGSARSKVLELTTDFFKAELV